MTGIGSLVSLNHVRSLSVMWLEIIISNNIMDDGWHRQRCQHYLSANERLQQDDVEEGKER